MPSIAPLAGVKVIEVANFLAVPLAGAMMADLGADVVKVEPLAGDPGRYAFIKDKEFDFNFPTKYPFELTNRGKRSMTLDLERQESLEVLSAAAGMADVFITNLLPQRLKNIDSHTRICAPTTPGWCIWHSVPMVIRAPTKTDLVLTRPPSGQDRE